MSSCPSGDHAEKVPWSATRLKTPRENSKIHKARAPDDSIRVNAMRPASGEMRGYWNKSGERATPMRCPFRSSQVICFLDEPVPKTNDPMPDTEKLASMRFGKNPTDSAVTTGSPVVFRATGSNG